MKKSLLTLLLLGVLSACSQSDDTQKPTSPSSSATKVAAPSVNSSTEKSAEQPAVQSDKANSDDAGILNYKEKLDIAKIGLALQEAGFAEAANNGKEAEWNQRLASAKSNEDVQSVLREQLAIYRKGAEYLASKQMDSTQGKAVHEKLLGSIQGAQAVLEKMITIDLASPEGVVQANELMPKVKQHMQDLAQGMQMWVEMMKNNGFSPSEADEAKLREKLKELEEKIR